MTMVSGEGSAPRQPDVASSAHSSMRPARRSYARRASVAAVPGGSAAPVVTWAAAGGVGHASPLVR
jgi:hypothetical protein